jgi:hypothetical protein
VQHWLRKLPTPVDLRDGRRLESLGDAADLIIARANRRPVREHWRVAAELLRRAAAPSATDLVIASFALQLQAALRADEFRGKPVTIGAGALPQLTPLHTAPRDTD